MNPNPGWFPDPGGKFAERYWDGNAWTASVRSVEMPRPWARPPLTPPEPTTATPDPPVSGRGAGRVPPPTPELAAAPPAPPPAQPELPPSPPVGGRGEAWAASEPGVATARPFQFSGKTVFWIGMAVIGLFTFWAGVQDAGVQIDNGAGVPDAGVQVDNKMLEKGEAAFVAAVEQRQDYDASVSEEANWARYGQGVCRTLGEGEDPAFVAANLGMSLSDGNFIVNTATKYLCPRYR